MARSERPPSHRLRTLRKRRRRKGWRHRLRRRLRWRSVPGVEWLGTRAFPSLYTAYLALVWRTSRVSVQGMDAARKAYEDAGGIVALLWHEDAALSYYAWAKLGVRPHILVNESFAGDISAAIARRCGYTTFRGGASSGRSRNRPEALRLMIAHMRRERGVVYGVAVDGSAGPRYRLKRGALVVARECGVPVALVRIVSTPCLHLPTWDRTAVPLPFGRILVAVDAPHPVPASARSRPALLEVAGRLEARLVDLAAESLRTLGRPLPDALRERLADSSAAPPA